MLFNVCRHFIYIQVGTETVIFACGGNVCTGLHMDEWMNEWTGWGVG